LGKRTGEKEGRILAFLAFVAFVADGLGWLTCIFLVLSSHLHCARAEGWACMVMVGV
jgi:hypothetical protein